MERKHYWTIRNKHTHKRDGIYSEVAEEAIRPSDNPKPYKIGIKLDKESKDILDAYCKQESVSMVEAARRGIKRLKSDLKK